MRRSSPLITIGKGRARHMEDEIGQHLNNLCMSKSVFIRGLKRQATISMIIHIRYLRVEWQHLHQKRNLSRCY